MINVPLNNLDDGSAEPTFYFVRRRGTAGITHDALRAKVEPVENMVCLLLFATQLDAFEYLKFKGLDPDQWEFAGSEDFGGIASLLKKASKLSTHTPTHVLFNPPMEHGPLVMTPPTIESAIDYFESLPAEDWVNGGLKIPFWLLRNEAGGAFGIVPEPGIFAVCLFKSEMDAEEFRHSWWIPDETPADEWECVWPANPDDAVAYLEEISSKGISHAVINVPPDGTQRPLITPIEVIIDHVASRGHIQDLDSP